jgi:hypothetical protein
MAALVKQMKSRFVHWVKEFKKITPANGMNTTIAEFIKQLLRDGRGWHFDNHARRGFQGFFIVAGHAFLLGIGTPLEDRL